MDSRSHWQHHRQQNAAAQAELERWAEQNNLDPVTLKPKYHRFAARCAEASKSTEELIRENEGGRQNHPPVIRTEEQIQRYAERRRATLARRRARLHTTVVEYFTRDQVIDRDGRTCYLCGRDNLNDGDIHIDHVVPLCRGGTHTLANVRVACAPCNIRKGARDPSEYPPYTG
jgi:5-methylcytosine-specific restriction endonuclease McrA